MNQLSPIHQDVLNEVKAFHKSESRILDLLQKIDSSRLYLEVGYPSLFKYTVGYLKLSEAQAWAFMTVARKSKEVPQLKEQIDAGELSVSTAKRIVPVLEQSNHDEWITKAKSMTKSDLEREVAKVSPHAFKKKEVIRALSATDSSVRFQIPEEKLKRWKRMQTLMMSKKRKALDLMCAIDELVELFLQKEDPLRKVDKVLKPGLGQGQSRMAKRQLPVAIKRGVLQRDKGKCQFRSENGIVCGNDIFVQIHHLQPWAFGGSHELDNLQTLCSSHHALRHAHTRIVLNTRKRN